MGTALGEVKSKSSQIPALNKPQMQERCFATLLQDSSVGVVGKFEGCSRAKSQSAPHGLAAGVRKRQPTWTRLLAGLLPAGSRHGSERNSKHVCQNNPEFYKCLLQSEKFTQPHWNQSANDACSKEKRER
eukprot:3435746-Amphidinium_carterae.1